jgi:esterase/lipase superfamily enzyme
LGPSTELSIIAHSLGSRIAQNLVLELARTGRVDRVSSMIFAAPDQDQGRFKQNVDRTQSYAHAQGATLHETTLYASSNDKCLIISSFIHRSRGGSEVRAGSGGHEVILLTDHVESVDASELWNGFWHHDYLFTNLRAMKDYNQVLMHKLNAQARGLPVWWRNGRAYWLLTE